MCVSYGFEFEAVIGLSFGFNLGKPLCTFLGVPACLPMCISFEGLCVCEEQQERQCHARLGSA